MLLQPLGPAAAVRHAAPQARRARVLVATPHFPIRSRCQQDTVPAQGGSRVVTARARADREELQGPDEDDLGAEEDIDEFEEDLNLDDEFGDLVNPGDDDLGVDDPLDMDVLKRRLEGRMDPGSRLQELAALADLDLDGEVEEGEELEGEEAPQEMDKEGKYPKRPERSFFIADLFGHAAFYDMGVELEEKFPDVGVHGLQSYVERVEEGDLYCCPATEPEQVPALVTEALSRGATALLLPDTAEDLPEMEGVVPEGVPVFYVESVDGAASRLAVAFYEAPSREMLMIAVVGEHGKTTTSWLIRGILEEMEQVTGMVGSIEVALAEDRLDEDGNVWQAREEDTTATRECSAPFMVTPYQGKYTLPDRGLSGLQTQKVLAGLRERGASCCVYEASPAVIQERLSLWVDVSVVVHTVLLPPPVSTGSSSTSVAEVQQHEAEARAALEPFEKLVDPVAQAVVVNLDDPLAHLVLEAASAVPAVTYAYDNQQADVVAEDVKHDIWESEMIVRTPLGRLQIITPLLGRHNVYNILAAVATGLALKVPLKSIVAGIEAVEIIPGRCEVVDEGQEFSVIVDGANTPEALKAMLSSLRDSAKRIITVFGCKGEEDRSIRPLMAEVAHSFSDMVILTNDSPRTEPPENIVQDIVAGLPDSIIKRYSGYVYFPFQDQGHVPLWFEPYLQKAQKATQRYVMEDRFSAIRAAIGTAAPGDVVVLAGRGHSDFMEYEDGEGGVVRGWFDDRLEARSALSKLAYLNQLTKLNRKTLPWGKALDEMDSLIDPPAIRQEENTPEPSTRSRATSGV